ncbi:MAG: lipid-A-disaccharide synthase [Deferrisomatales bacterium]
MPTIALVAGEASGDVHAANLLRALRRRCPGLRAWAVGGDALARAGAEIVFSSDRLSALGLTEVMGRLPEVLRARRQVVERFRRSPPECFVPVDFGGLNLSLAAAARARGVPVTYYIPPKVWAWGRWRVRRLRRVADRALVVLPFEEAFFRAHGVPATYVGSPVLDHLQPRRRAPEPDVVGLLPGSRPGEVRRIWPPLRDAACLLARDRPLRFLVPRAPAVPEALLGEASRAAGLDVTVLDGRAQEVMERARLCLVASGTATLECALLGTPMVIVYRVSRLTWAVGRLLVQVPFVGLPNLIAGREVVPERVQASPRAVAGAAAALLEDGPARNAALDGLAEVRRILGAPGASERAAREILEHLAGTPPCD